LWQISRQGLQKKFKNCHTNFFLSGETFPTSWIWAWLTTKCSITSSRYSSTMGHLLLFLKRNSSMIFSYSAFFSSSIINTWDIVVLNFVSDLLRYVKNCNNFSRIGHRKLLNISLITPYFDDFSHQPLYS